MKLAATSCALIVAGSPVAAAPHAVFDEFDHICIKTDADATAAYEAASSRGWVSVPAAMAKFVADPDCPTAKTKTKTVGGAVWTFAACILKVANRPVARCGVAAHSIDNSLLDDAADWVGLPADSRDTPSSATYVWLESDGKHFPLNAAEQIFQSKEEAKSHLRTLDVATTKHGSFAVYLADPKEPH